jgi:hypothetical protein
MKKPVKNNLYKNLTILCGISILVEILIIVSVPMVFNSFIDQWGFKVYFETIIIPFVSNGNLPYIDYFWEYPIIMVVPVFVAAIPSILTRNADLFLIAFPILMILCNLVVTALVCILTLKIYKSEKRAFIAGFLYATAISAAYITITNFDSLPAMLMMLGLTCTIYGGEKLKSAGYLAYILGFFTKIYPVAILPFIILFNAKKTSLKNEVLSAIGVFVIPFLVLFVPIYALNPSSINTYLITNAAGKEIFVDSFVYTVYSWFHGIFRLPVTIPLVSNLMTAILVVTIISLLYLAYTYPMQDATFLLQVTLVALVAIIACSKYHSPQYMLWIMPIFCILVAGDLLKMGMFYLLQVIWFIKFPLLFWNTYTNGEYTHPLPSAGGYLTVFFFTIEYAILFYLVWMVVKREGQYVSQ